MQNAELWHNTVSESFHIIDQDGSHTIDAGELRHLFYHGGIKITRKETEEFIHKWNNKKAAEFKKIVPVKPIMPFYFAMHSAPV